MKRRIIELVRRIHWIPFCVGLSIGFASAGSVRLLATGSVEQFLDKTFTFAALCVVILTLFLLCAALIIVLIHIGDDF